jgi:hypothetical protein
MQDQTLLRGSGAVGARQEIEQLELGAGLGGKVVRRGYDLALIIAMKFLRTIVVCGWPEGPARRSAASYCSRTWGGIASGLSYACPLMTIFSVTRGPPYCTAFTMSKIGRYMATTIPPTTTPSTTIMIGSMRESIVLTAASTSSS